MLRSLLKLSVAALVAVSLILAPATATEAHADEVIVGASQTEFVEGLWARLTQIEISAGGGDTIRVEYRRVTIEYVYEICVPNKGELSLE